jgi:hypothetical protein
VNRGIGETFLKEQGETFGALSDGSPAPLFSLQELSAALAPQAQHGCGIDVEQGTVNSASLLSAVVNEQRATSFGRSAFVWPL